jgi:hypothetical protein
MPREVDVARHRAVGTLPAQPVPVFGRKTGAAERHTLRHDR